MSSIRRVFFYVVSLISLGILAAGIRVLLSLLFDLAFGGSNSLNEAAFVRQQLSLGLALIVIGGPLWYLFWHNIQKHVTQNRAEIESVMRQVFLKLILVVTSLMSLAAAESFLSWLMAGVPGGQNAGGSLAQLIVTSAIWFYYWKISENEGHPSPSARTLRRWYVYIASGWGLVQLALGVVQFIHAGALALPLWGPTLISSSFWTGEVQSSLTWILLGGLFWAFHWFRMSRGDVDSVLRQVYIYLLAITGSSIAGLVSLVMGLYNILVWAMGSAGSMNGYFQFLGWVIPAVVVSAAVWSYHQVLAGEESGRQQERRLSARRVHLYIMSFIGLGTMVAGIVILLGVLIDLIINSIQAPLAVESGWWQKQVSLFLALLMVSAPIWWAYWNQVIRLAAAGGVVEWRARARRIYLYVIIGAAIIALAADLVNIFYQLLSSGLAGNLDIHVLRNCRWSIQSLIVAAPLLAYHWQIARSDQRRGAETAAERKKVTVLAGTASQAFVSRLEEKLGGKINLLQYAGVNSAAPELTDEALNEMVSRITSAPAGKVMVVFHEGQVLVLPYQEK
jgi:hypothetical protein